jgi:hypothetical protein
MKGFTPHTGYIKEDTAKRVLPFSLWGLHRLAKPTAILCLLLAGLVNGAWGQTNGDYRTRAAGNWNAYTTWQVYNDAWVNCAAGNYPGATPGAGIVTIRATHNVTLNVNATISGLEINANLTATTNRTLNITGTFNLINGTVNLSNQNGRSATVNLGGNFIMSGGTLTEGANQFVSFVFNGGTTQTFTKTGGTISNTINFTVNSGTTLDMGTSVLDGSNGTFTLSNGAILATAHTQGLAYTGATGSVQSTGTRTINTGANLVYNGTSAQVTGSFNASSTINNLTINNPAGVTLSNATTVNGTLTLTSGVLTIGDLNLTLSSTNAIGGSPFSSTNMVGTNGNGYLIRNAGTGTPIVFPVGSNGFYSPVSIASVSPTTGNLSVRTVNDASLGSNYLPRYWDIATTTSDKTITATFTYDAAESAISPTNIWVRPSGGSWQTPTGSQSFPANGFTITGTTNITTAANTNWTAGLLPDTYFSYQTGPWDQPSTWTSDPGGTTQEGTTIPVPTTWWLSSPAYCYPYRNVATTGLEVNINTGVSLISPPTVHPGLKALREGVAADRLGLFPNRTRGR